MQVRLENSRDERSVTMSKKEMPHSYNSEKGLFANILLDTEKLYQVDLKPSEFYNEKHKTLWAEIQKHSNEYTNWDTVTLYEHLDKAGKMADIGGVAYYMELQDAGAVGINTLHYAKVIRGSEEHTSELQSRLHLVCRLLLEKKNHNHRQAEDQYQNMTT